MSEPIPNPNVTNAKRRGGARPKSVNTPAESSSKSFKWVEPLPQPLQVDVGFEFNQEVETPLRFEIDYLLPSTIAAPYVEILTGTVYRQDGSQDLVDRLTPALEALSYFKCAQKLFATMTPDAQSKVQPLKGVFYDTLPIPNTMSRLIDSIGNFDSAFGPARVSYQTTTFLRWVAKGLSVGIDLSEIDAPGPDDGTPLQFIWKSQEALDLVHCEAKAKLEELVSETYRLDAFDGEGEAITIDARFPEWDNNYAATALFPDDDRENWRAYSICAELELRHLDVGVALPAGTPPTWDVTDLLSTIGLTLAPATYSFLAMKDAFITFQSRYSRSCKMHIDAYFTTCSPVKGDSGYASQFVNSAENKLDSMFPLSDADAVNGFILNPLKSLTFNSKYVSYSKRPKRAATSDVAFQSTKSVAH